MKILYFDCFAGAAGDMILGALLDAGLPFDELKRALGSLAVEGWDVSVDRVVKTGVTATKFRVHEHVYPGAGSREPFDSGREGASLAHGRPGAGHHHKHHHLKHIFEAIERSALSDAGKQRAIAMFRRLGEAEAAIHGTTLEKVHLHEVGALDSIIDIVGAVFAFEWCNADRVVVSPINVGSGMIKTVHGLYPVPAPATVRLLANAPIYGRDVKTELLTPTGALILSDYASDYGPMPAMRVERSGYGAGDRDLEGTPNVLRLVIGKGDRAASAIRVAVIECEIDDMNPQIFGVLMDRLYAAGALDVFYAPVQMKKNRPGTLVTIIAKPDQRESLIDLMFRESTTIGVRSTEMARECLDRETVDVVTPIGNVRFKVATRDGKVFNAQPEFEDVAKLAEDQGRPIKEVQAIAMKAWLDRR